MIIGVILAAGKGSRMKLKDTNKTSVHFNGKPLIQYGIDVFRQTTDETVIVVGAHAQSVKDAIISHPHLSFAEQKRRLGTGHAVKVAIDAIKKYPQEPEIILVGYGDHMMFYTPEIINKLIAQHKKHKAAVTLITTEYNDPNSLAWGRIIRKNSHEITRIVEQKDATVQEQAVTEVNPGFYCFDYQFLKKHLGQIRKSKITNEYYLTDFIEIAARNLKVAALKVPFKYVGIGINTTQQLHQSENLYTGSSPYTIRETQPVV